MYIHMCIYKVEAISQCLSILAHFDYTILAVDLDVIYLTCTLLIFFSENVSVNIHVYANELSVIFLHVLHEVEAIQQCLSFISHIKMSHLGSICSHVNIFQEAYTFFYIYLFSGSIFAACK